ncbi:MAG: aryl-sulfate sulfotransferase [Eubacteriales bacterium]|nr:aryl-sulfate sulfotransferase [Eubacteriales bacterium]
MKKRKAVLAALLALSMASAMMGCQSTPNSDASRQEENMDQASRKIEAGGWELIQEDAIKNNSLENVSVDLGYTGVETSDYKKEASQGKTFCLIKMQMNKKDSAEDIVWDKLILKDAKGNEYTRIDDSFLTDLGMMRMPSASLNFGENEGWIAFEIDENAEDLTLTYAFEEDSYECRVSFQTAGKQTEEESLITTSETYAGQKSITASLEGEVKKGYSFEEPKVILDPYGNSPLTAVVVFTTEEKTSGTITVKGKNEKDDITGTFRTGYSHLIPVYGLYNGETTKVVLTLEDGRSKELEITTEKQEVNFGEITAQMKDESAYDYSKLTFVCSAGGGLYAVDSQGDIRWLYKDSGTLGVHQISNGHLLVPTSYTVKPTYYKSGLKEIDLSGRVYKEYGIPGGMHHDFYEMENGNYLVAGDSSDLTAVEDHIVEIDGDNGDVVWELDMADILDKEDGFSASAETDGSEEVDWFHNNGVWYDEEKDLILLSARHKDAIIAIHKKEKTLAWILGDPDGWNTVDQKYFFTPQGDDFEWQYAQHQVTMLDNGDIMMFDNGTAKVKGENAQNRVTGDDIYSRAVVYRIDTENMTIEQVFEYGKERGPEWYSDWISGSVSLDGTQNNLWITAGSNLYSEEEDRHDFYPKDMFVPGLVKTTHMDQVVNGELVYELKVSGEQAASLTYRSFRMPMYTGTANLTISDTASVVGSLGETKSEKVEASLESAEKMDTEGWTFLMDELKFAVNGTYQTQTKANELKEGYLVLSNEDKTKVYALNQSGTDSEDGTSVSASGWCSVDGLAGEVFEVYLVLDGVAYDTGKQAEFTASDTVYHQDGSVDYGYYRQVTDISIEPSATTNILENDSFKDSVETTLQTEDTLVAQSKVIDDEIQTEVENGKHTWEKPMVLTNPYKISPLTAVVVFDTEESCKVRVTVKGKTKDTDISGTLAAAASHRVPVVGLYAGTENTVLLELLDENDNVTDSQELKIETDPLSDYFDDLVDPVKTSKDSTYDLTMVYGQSTTYPYAIDSQGDIRWYIERKSGNYGIFNLSNNRFIFQDDTGYTPTQRKPMTTNMYEMDYLGRAYNLYYVANGIHHDVIEKEPGGNLLVLTSSLDGHEEEAAVEIDRATGEIVNTLKMSEIFGSKFEDRVDWAHLNTISYQAEDDTVLLSPRNIHAAVKVNWTTHELVWILSDPAIWKDSGFEDYVLQPEGDFNWHYQQHAVYEAGADLDGNPDTLEITMFDNHWDGYSPVDSFDGLTESYSKVYSINEADKTVRLLKEYPAVLSYITSNTIYDADSNHVFANSSQIYEPQDNTKGMLYEYDYETGEIISQFALGKISYRAEEMQVDFQDLANPMKLDENYIKGTLKPLASVEEEIEMPSKMLEDELSFKMVGSVLYVHTLDHRISQVIFKGKEHTYAYDSTNQILKTKDYFTYESDIVMPMGDMEPDDYEILVMYKDVFYNTGETIVIK